MLKRKGKHGEPPEPPVMPTRTNKAGWCEPPKCPACQLGKQHRRPHRHSHAKTRPEREMSIKRDDLEPGDRISVDQCKSSSAGRLPNTCGCETSNLRYKGGSIFVDHAAVFVMWFVCLGNRRWCQSYPQFMRECDNVTSPMRCIGLPQPLALNLYLCLNL